MPALPDVPLPDISVCGGPLQPVCDTVGGLTQSVTQTTADLVLGSVGESFVAAADQVSQTALQALDATTSVRLTADWFQANVAVLAAVALPVVLGLFVLQVITAVLRREPGGLSRAVVGVGKAMLGAALAVAVTQSALVACDQVCEAIAGAAGTSVTGAARRFVNLSWLAGPQAGPVLQILLSLALIVGFLMLWAVMLFRKAALFLIVVFAPIAFAGAVFDHTRSWTRRWIEAVAALVLCKLVVVVVFIVGAGAFSATGPSTTTPTVDGTPAGAVAGSGGSLSDTLAGALLLSIAVLAPWMTYRFLHWTGSEAAELFHSHLATSPVPQALRSTARQAQVGGQRALTAAMLSSGAGAAVAAAGTAAGRRPPVRPQNVSHFTGPTPLTLQAAGSGVPRRPTPAAAGEGRSQ